VRARERVLEIACEMFAETGFHGTHLREICKRAETNVAAVCYHFHSKEGLYEAVSMEAGRRLCELDDRFATGGTVQPEQKLLQLIDSLLQLLTSSDAWIAKLLTRELVDSTCEAHNYAASGLEKHLIVFEAVVRGLAGIKASRAEARFHALSLIGECVFYSVARASRRHPLAQNAVSSQTRQSLARFLTHRVLGALRFEAAELEARVVSKF